MIRNMSQKIENRRIVNMPEPVPWPTHGRAKTARDDSAVYAAKIKSAADQLAKKLEGEQPVTESDIALGLLKIVSWSSDILRLLESQGAPTEPLPPTLQ
jgi:hypothetical protein